MEETPVNNGGISDVDEGESPGSLSRKRFSRKRAVISAVVVALALGLILGGRWFAFGQTHVSTDDAQVEPEIYPASARVAGHMLHAYVEENQSVRAGQVLAEIDPRDYQVAVDQARAALMQARAAAEAAAGTVNVTRRTGGAGVSQAQAGVAAARARKAMSERERASALSQVKSAQAAEKAAEAAVEMARKGVTSATAALVGAQANADQARKDAARMEALVKQGAVSTQQQEAAGALAVSAQANVEAAQAQASSAQSGVALAQERQRQASLGVTQAEEAAASAQAAVAQAEAAVRQAVAGKQSSLSNPEQIRVRRSEAGSAKAQVAIAEALLAQAKLNLWYTRIVASIDGVVAEKDVREGQYVQPGQLLVAIVPQLHTHLLANFKETQLKRIKPGQKVAFTVDAYPSLRFSGRVESISPGTGSVFTLLPPENASGNFTKVVQRVPVRIVVDGKQSPNRPLRAGMNVMATVDVG